MVGLPNDLVLFIFELEKPAPAAGEAPELDDIRHFYRLLCKYALVCRRWAICAQELLFRNVVPRGGHRRVSSANVVASLLAAPDALRQKTRSMALRVGKVVRLHRPEVLATHLSWQQFADLLKAFPKLKTLAVHLHSLDVLQPELDPEQLDCIRDNTSVQRLALRAHVSVQAIVMCQLVSVWPGLLSLEIAAASDAYSNDDILEDGLSSVGALEHLCELQVFMSGQIANRWLDKIFSTMRNLTSLRCEMADLATFLPHLHDTVKHLVVDGTSGELAPSRALSRCTALVAVTFTMKVTMDDLASLPQTVQHLGAIIDPGSLARFIKDRAALRAIVVVWSEGNSPSWTFGITAVRPLEEAEKVATLCTERKIELQVMPDVTWIADSRPTLR